MKAPKNRRVFVIGYGAATPLGKTFETTWDRAIRAEAGFRRLTRCSTESRANIVGEIPDWDPMTLDFMDRKEAYSWNADYVFLTMAVCKAALKHAGLEIDNQTGPRTACLIGSALNGTDAFRIAMDNYVNRGPLRVSPYLLPNLCANLPSGKAGILLGFTGPIFSPQSACASGNYAIGIGARMIRDGDCDFVLAGGVDTCLIPEIIKGFANVLTTINVSPQDRADQDPTQASRPFSIDRKGIVLSEGAGVIVLASEDRLSTYGLKPKAEVLGVGWTSDAYHFLRCRIRKRLCAPCIRPLMTPGLNRKTSSMSMPMARQRAKEMLPRSSASGKCLAGKSKICRYPRINPRSDMHSGLPLPLRPPSVSRPCSKD